MKTWVVDAIDLKIDSTDYNISDFREHLLLTNSASERYLDDENATELVVVGPKGYGKTLLLKMKRLIVQDKPGVQFLPRNELVDKIVPSAPIKSSAEMDVIRSDANYWLDVWLLTFSIASIKISDPPSELPASWLQTLAPTTQTLILSDEIRRPSDLFLHLVQLSRKEFYSVRRDISRLVPRFNRIHVPLWIFVDNVDEYFQVHLRA